MEENQTGPVLQREPSLLWLVKVLAISAGIEFLRKRRGDLTYQQFSRKLGISDSTLQRLGIGHQNVTLKTLGTDLRPAELLDFGHFRRVERQRSDS
jgi:hypothetical protein